MYSGRLGVIYDSQVTNRSAAGEGALTGSPPCFLLVAWESYSTTSRMAMHFIIAIRITVNFSLFDQKKQGALVCCHAADVPGLILNSLFLIRKSRAHWYAAMQPMFLVLF